MNMMARLVSHYGELTAGGTNDQAGLPAVQNLIKTGPTVRVDET
jgi:hypothetical protein